MWINIKIKMKIMKKFNLIIKKFNKIIIKTTKNKI
jgi:hypothetical protein